MDTDKKLPEGLWKGWNAEDFMLATYCGICGLPLIPSGSELVCPICDTPIDERSAIIIDALVYQICVLRGKLS